MERRKILTGIGTVGMATVAGCSSSDDGSTESSGDDGSSEAEETGGDDGGSETEESGGNDESSETEESSNLEERTHQIGETFTVGEGDRAIEYTVNDMVYANQLGNEFSSVEANGLFHIIILSLTNKSDESFTVTSDNYELVTGEGNVYEAAGFEARTALDTDERIDVESLSFEQLNPELSTEGAVIFDAPEDAQFVFRIQPAGFLDTSEPQLVQPGGE